MMAVEERHRYQQRVLLGVVADGVRFHEVPRNMCNGDFRALFHRDRPRRRDQSDRARCWFASGSFYIFASVGIFSRYFHAQLAVEQLKQMEPMPYMTDVGRRR